MPRKDQLEKQHDSGVRWDRVVRPSSSSNSEKKHDSAVRWDRVVRPSSSSNSERRLVIGRCRSAIATVILQEKRWACFVNEFSRRKKG